MQIMPADNLTEQLFAEIVLKGVCPVKQLSDNKSPINSTYDPFQQDHMMHVKVDHHFIKEKLDIGDFCTPNTLSAQLDTSSGKATPRHISANSKTSWTWMKMSLFCLFSIVYIFAPAGLSISSNGFTDIRPFTLSSLHLLYSSTAYLHCNNKDHRRSSIHQVSKPRPFTLLLIPLLNFPFSCAGLPLPVSA